jgi:hypothetical protein
LRRIELQCLAFRIAFILYKLSHNRIHYLIHITSQKHQHEHYQPSSHTQTTSNRPSSKNVTNVPRATGDNQSGDLPILLGGHSSSPSPSKPLPDQNSSSSNAYSTSTRSITWKFEWGDEVEVLGARGVTWFPATVCAASASGGSETARSPLYDVLYDEYGREDGVQVRIAWCALFECGIGMLLRALLVMIIVLSAACCVLRALFALRAAYCVLCCVACCVLCAVLCAACCATLRAVCCVLRAACCAACCVLRAACCAAAA